VFKKFLNKRYEKRKLEAETTCQRAYERLQEVGIEVFKVDIKYVHVSSWQPTFVITIDATGNVHQYQLSKTIDDNKDNTWKFTEGHSTRSMKLEDVMKIMVEPCRKQHITMYRYRRQWLKESNYEEFVRLYYHTVPVKGS
jgi:hypothetical protein